MSGERKFVKNLMKCSAARVREAASEAVRERAVVPKPDLIDPIDYEAFVLRNKTLLQNDPHPNLLLFPSDDVSQSTLARRFRTTQCSVTNTAVKDATSLLVKECIKSYTSNWAVIHYKYTQYAGSYLQLPSTGQNEALPQQVFEVDTEEDGKDDIGSRLPPGRHVTKQGWLYKGPDSGHESSIINFAKSFKRRYFYLTQQKDSTFVMELHKDEKRHEAKETIFLDSAVSVNKSTKRQKNFEIHMQDKSFYTFSSDSAADVEEWVAALKKVVQQNTDMVTSPDKYNRDSINRDRDSYDQAADPVLRRDANESEMKLAQSRKDNRQKVFQIYPDLKRGSPSDTIEESCGGVSDDVDVYRETFGTRFIVQCDEFRTRLQANVAEEGQPEKMDNPEPFFVTLALYDARECRKISEDFNFDPNSSDVELMLHDPHRSTGEPPPHTPPHTSGGPTSSSSVANGVTNGATKTTQPELPNVGHVLNKCKQCIFSVMTASRDIYLVAKVSKVLSGSIAPAAEPYTRNPDSRIGTKLHRTMRVYCSRLGQYRMPVAWGARPVFNPYSKDLDTYSDFALYKQETSKMSTDDIVKLLQDFKKPEKQSKWIPFLATLKVSLSPLDPKQLLSHTLTTTLLPVKTSTKQMKSERHSHPDRDSSVVLEIEEFSPDSSEVSSPYVSYCNHLYVYPRCLKYDGQKSFAKARNLACSIEIRDNDTEHTQPMRCIYNTTHKSVFVSSVYTPVLHHECCPEFNTEVKIVLPTQLHDKHHVLFTFYHISCELPKSAKKQHLLETVVGYAWFPILVNGRVNVGEQNCKVAMSLVPGYLTKDQTRGTTLTDIRWVDGGKPLFKFNMSLVSSIYTQDQHLHNFFAHCDKLKSGSTISNEMEKDTSNKLKSLHAVDLCVLIRFLPTLFNQLFCLLTVTHSDEVAINAVRVLIHGVNEIERVKKSRILQSYVKFVFVTEPVASNKHRSVHEELAQHLKAILRPTQSDFLVVGKFMKHSWFFFEILIKSMAQHLISTGRIKMSRAERFPSSYQFHIQTLVQTLTTHIVQKAKESPIESRNANTNLANFIKKCFTFMDRGFVFKLINKYIDNFNPGDPTVLYEYKFDFLRIISSHEHFIALNMPMMRKHVKNYRDIDEEDLKQDYLLSEDYRQQHFLVGMLIHETKLALNEQPQVRKLAITTLRNLLAKHSFDNRYAHKGQQSRIAMLYLPLITIILENKHRFSHKSDGSSSLSSIQSSPVHPVAGSELGSSSTTLSPSDLCKQLPPAASYTSVASLADNASVTTTASSPAHNHANMGASPGSRLSTRDPAVFQLISQGQTTSMQNLGSALAMDTNKPSHHDSNTSLASTTSSTSQSTTLDSKEAKILQSALQAQRASTGHSLSQLSINNATAQPVVIKQDKLDKEETKDLLISFVYIIKNLAEEILLGWFSNSPESDILDFFGILEIAMQHFKYLGKKRITSLCFIGDSKSSRTLPTKRGSAASMAANMQAYARTGSLHGDKDGGRSNATREYHAPSESEANAMYRTMLEANLSCEVALVVLDVISLYSVSFKDQLSLRDGENAIMKKVFELYMNFLQTSQSENVQKHTFASLRSFINRFPKVLFKGDAVMCGRLCYQILRCCNSRLNTTRSEACAVMYLMMKRNFEFLNKVSFTRVHLQMIISVSQLISNIVGLTNSRFHDSLSVINSYASSDKSLQKSVFPVEVKDLTRRIRTVLMATSQMREHQNDPEMLVDLQYALAKSYASTPELRKTWLDSMAKIHMNNANFSEAAHCYVHIAALIAEYLKRRGKLHSCFPQGCAAFKAISPNVEPEEGGMRDDSGMQDVQYTEENLTDLLQDCAKFFERAERYEVLGTIYKMIIPIYERKRDFAQLKNSYTHLQQAYSKIVDVMQSGKRMLGKYFRVSFFGQLFFENEDGKEYIYKEPKITGLTEICDRLKSLYSEKFGKDVVKLIMDSNKVEAEELDPKLAYIQVTYVTPYFDERELEERKTEFERNNNIRRFVYETPFTRNGKARGDIHEQYMRRTILTTSHAFPYVKKRIQVVYHRDEELTPIEVAIDAMSSKVNDLQAVVDLSVPDIKRLQLKLQGSISVTVHAGPMAYADTFLSEDEKHKYRKDKVEMLKTTFRDFIKVCKAALDLNGLLITTDQYDYHKSLLNSYRDMATKLSIMFEEQLIEDDVTDSASRRSSSINMFSVISSTNNTSNV